MAGYSSSGTVWVCCVVWVVVTSLVVGAVQGYVDQADCPTHRTGFFYGADTCFYVSRSRQTWQDAKAQCHVLRMEMAVIENPEQDMYLEEILRQRNKGEEYWLGGIRRDGVLVWDRTGVPLDSGYTNWHPGNPDNRWNREDCVATWYRYQWNDRECTKRLRYVCVM